MTPAPTVAVALTRENLGVLLEALSRYADPEVHDWGPSFELAKKRADALSFLLRHALERIE